MKALVSVKRVIEHSVKIRLKQGAAGVLPTVDTLGVKMSINPFDEVAIEEAVRLKEKGIVKEVVAFSVGDKKASDTLRTALALGADRACHVLSEDADAQPLTVAKLLSTYVEVERPDLVLMGKQSIDGDNVQTPQMLAGLLNWPQATFASKIDWSEDNSEVLVVREVSAGLETVRLPLPAVISVDLRLNTPRYPTLPAVMKAKKKPVKTLVPADLHVDIQKENLLEVLAREEAVARPKGVMVGSVDELLEKLREVKALP